MKSQNLIRRGHRKNAKMRVDRAFTYIDKEIINIFSNENYESFLNYAANMNHFDFYNIVLLWLQPIMINQEKIKDRASFISSFVSWNKKGNMIKQKSTGLLILVPYCTNNYILNSKKDYYVLTNKEKEEMLFYTTGTVFDVAQTTATKCESNKNVVDEKKLFRCLIVACEKKGYRIYLENEYQNTTLKQLKHYSNIHDKQIIISLQLSDKEKILYAVFEYIYSILYEKLETEEMDNKINNLLYFQAESVMFLLSQYYGLIMDSISLNKTAKKWEEEQYEIKKILQQIISIFQELVFQINYELEVQKVNETALFDFEYMEDELEEVKSDINITLDYMEISIINACFPPLFEYAINEQGIRKQDEKGNYIKQRVQTINLKFKDKVELIKKLEELSERSEDPIIKCSMKRLIEKFMMIDNKKYKKLKEEYMKEKIVSTETYKL